MCPVAILTIEKSILFCSWKYERVGMGTIHEQTITALCFREKTVRQSISLWNYMIVGMLTVRKMKTHPYNVHYVPGTIGGLY